MANGHGDKGLTCWDSAKGRVRTKEQKHLTWTDDWSKQHADPFYRAFTKPSYLFNKGNKGPKPAEPNCQRDEWPPAQLLPDDKQASSPEGKKLMENGQVSHPYSLALMRLPTLYVNQTLMTDTLWLIGGTLASWLRERRCCKGMD